MKTRYAVVQIDNGRNNPHTGLISGHRTAEAAQSAIERANKRLRRLPGYKTAWYPYAVLDCATGEYL
jgi:hypothetical protein